MSQNPSGTPLLSVTFLMTVASTNWGTPEFAPVNGSQDRGMP